MLVHLERERIRIQREQIARGTRLLFKFVHQWREFLAAILDNGRPLVFVLSRAFSNLRKPKSSWQARAPPCRAGWLTPIHSTGAVKRTRI